MAILGNNVKTAFLKGLETLGKKASSLSDAAQQKLSEMNLDTRRREVLSEIPKCVMQLWKDGVELPEPLTALLGELTELEEKLAALRPQPEVKAEEEPKPEETAEEAAEEPAETVEEPAEAPEEPACECAEENGCCECAQEDAACECAQEPCCEAAAEPETASEENA